MEELIETFASRKDRRGLPAGALAAVDGRELVDGRQELGCEESILGVHAINTLEGAAPIGPGRLEFVLLAARDRTPPNAGGSFRQRIEK